MKLTAKIAITGKIRTVTGLHIGGSKSALDIGGVDLNVIKTPAGVPFIPGSSLKGKLRSLLARTVGSVAVKPEKAAKDKKTDGNEKTDEDFPFLLEIFGSSGDADETKSEVTRLIVRDAHLDTEAFKQTFNEEDLELDYSDIKWENTIDRKTGTALHPRQLERVPSGAIFDFEMVYDVYDDNKKDGHIGQIRMALHLLEDDYIGGSGSRGYGKIKFSNLSFEERTIEDYYGKGATTS